jgi:hypothetical protein
LEGFLFSQLPRTFQDAIHVTRELGKQYLWIDSLCIIQGEGGDWETEAQRMEKVFSCAYCTIAATSANGWHDGFLQQNAFRSYTSVQDVSGRRVSISSNIDDFENDVEEAQLNQRGWVLQERVLSRRIIHFALNHTYWECGSDLRCDNFATMRW